MYDKDGLYVSTISAHIPNYATIPGLTLYETACQRRIYPKTELVVVKTYSGPKEAKQWHEWWVLQMKAGFIPDENSLLLQSIDEMEEILLL